MIPCDSKLSHYQSGKISLHHMLVLVILVVGLIILFKRGYLPSIDKIPIIGSVVNYLQNVDLPDIPTPEFHFDNQTNNADANISNAGINDDINMEIDEDLLTPDIQEPQRKSENKNDITVLSDNGWQPPNYDDSPASNPDLLDKSTRIYVPPPITTPTKSTPVPTQKLPRPEPTITKPQREAKPAIPYPDALQTGYYTVQVHAGYNSKDAYNITRQLKKDGYQAFIAEKEDGQGQLFRVRIGQYQNLNSARAMRDQIRRRYPKSLSDSFVLLRQTQ